MPGHDDTGLPADRGSSDREARPGLSRRSVLWGAAGAGVAGVAATAFAGTAGGPAKLVMPATRGADAGAADAGTPEAATTEQIVVHVRNVKSGEIDVFRGTSQTRLHDTELAARLVRASR